MRLLRASAVFASGVVFGGVLPACRSCESSTSAPLPAPSAAAEAGAPEPAPPEDAAPSEPGAPAPPPAAILGAALDEACRGTKARPLDLGEAITDTRCAIRSSEAKLLLAVLPDAGLPLSQDASVVGDGSVEVRLHNDGAAPIVLPLSWHTRIAPMSALAEDEARALYELEPPRFRPARADGRVHFARIALAPGGVAFARVTPSTTVVKRILPPCEAGTCGPPALAPGAYTLHVGELLTDAPAGVPARVPWTVAPPPPAPH